MSRTVKHPNACRLPRCHLCHVEKKLGIPKPQHAPLEVDLEEEAIYAMWEESP